MKHEFTFDINYSVTAQLAVEAPNADAAYDIFEAYLAKHLRQVLKDKLATECPDTLSYCNVSSASGGTAGKGMRLVTVTQEEQQAHKAASYRRWATKHLNRRTRHAL